MPGLSRNRAHEPCDEVSERPSVSTAAAAAAAAAAALLLPLLEHEEDRPRSLASAAAAERRVGIEPARAIGCWCRSCRCRCRSPKAAAATAWEMATRWMLRENGIERRRSVDGGCCRLRGVAAVWVHRHSCWTRKIKAAYITRLTMAIQRRQLRRR